MRHWSWNFLCFFVLSYMSADTNPHLPNLLRYTADNTEYPRTRVQFPCSLKVTVSKTGRIKFVDREWQTYPLRYEKFEFTTGYFWIKFKIWFWLHTVYDCKWTKTDQNSKFSKTFSVHVSSGVAGGRAGGRVVRPPRAAECKGQQNGGRDRGQTNTIHKNRFYALNNFFNYWAN